MYKPFYDFWTPVDKYWQTPIGNGPSLRFGVQKGVPELHSYQLKNAIIAGLQGSGVSAITDLIVADLCTRYHPKDLRIRYIDCVGTGAKFTDAGNHIALIPHMEGLLSTVDMDAVWGYLEQLPNVVTGTHEVIIIKGWGRMQRIYPLVEQLQTPYRHFVLIGYTQPDTRSFYVPSGMNIRASLRNTPANSERIIGNIAAGCAPATYGFIWVCSDIQYNASETRCYLTPHVPNTRLWDSSTLALNKKRGYVKEHASTIIDVLREMAGPDWRYADAQVD